MGGLSLTTPIEALRGVGPARGEALRRLGIRSVAHLIDHVPFRYEREEAEGEIAKLEIGAIGAARGEVAAARAVRGRPGGGRGRGPRGRFEAVLTDGSGRLDLVWFNRMDLERRIVPGTRLRVRGKVRRFGPGGGGLQMSQPEYEVLADDANPAARGARLRPVYPASEDAPSSLIESLAVQAIEAGAHGLIADHLPADARERLNLPALAEAYRMAHAPASEEETRVARERLAFDEFLLLQLGLQMRRAELRAGEAAVLECDERIDGRVRARLPFTLTAGQDSAVREIVADLGRSSPANRLIQGDVGSGKTAVAVYAMLVAVANGKQAALLAPTTLLAEQHFAVVREMLSGSRVGVELLTGSLGSAERERVLSAVRREGTLAGGSDGATGADIVIGTHALLSEDVRFDDLALVVIDEQHRFGVHQRARLSRHGAVAEGGGGVHTLVMTATPIPRTLAMSAFGDLDVSVVAGLPAGRSAVATRWVEPGSTGEAWDAVRAAVGRGERAFIVEPTIDGDGVGEHGGEEGSGSLRGVEAMARELAAGALDGVRLGVLHGRLSSEERSAVMEKLRSGGLDAVVATTVIEVGVDVPEATVMVVDHAERFGMAQLHQLRGRVGRGQRSGVCYLIGEPVTPEASERLRALVEVSDGFELAERDLSLRGPGEVVGARQSGLVGFRVARLPGDEGLLERARLEAEAWVGRSPGLGGAEDAVARSRVLKRYGSKLSLVDVA